MTKTTRFEMTIAGKKVHLELTRRALKFLHSNPSPIYIGLELYFSCFVKKIIVAFDKKPERELFKAHRNLFIYFRPVQSKSCNIHDLIGKNSPTLIDFPVKKRRAIIPSSVKLDYNNDKWTGDFNWQKKNEKFLTH